MGVPNDAFHGRRVRAVALVAALFISTEIFAGDLDTVVPISVPAQPLSEALRSLAKQADLQISFPPEDVQNLQGSAIEGRYSPRAALAKLLAGTNLVVVEQAHDSIVVRRDTKVQKAPAPRPQPVPPTVQAPSETTNTGLDEIIVTAQRREQSLLSVASSVTATTGDQLNASGIQEISELQYTTPGYFTTDSAGKQLIFIRGVGNALFVGADPSVATFIDDVPRIYSSMVPNFVDVERVEVLKGAQGGLYGRNSTGGVVNIITTQPTTDKVSGNVLVDYGERNTLRVAGHLNLPLSDTLALGLTAERDAHDPYTVNVDHNPTPYTAANFPTGSYLGSPQQTANFFNSGVQRMDGYDNEDFDSVNAKLLWRPTDSFKVTVTGDYSQKVDTGGNQSVAVTPSIPQANLSGLLGEYGIHAVFPSNFFNQPAGKFTTVMTNSAENYIYDMGSSTNAVWSLPTVDLTSISAYRKQDVYTNDELSAISVPLTESLDRHHNWFMYQELRASSTGDMPFHFLGGATFLRDHWSEDGHVNLIPPLSLGPLLQSQTDIKNWSVYAQGGYDFTSALNLTVSGRYIHETNDTEFVVPIQSGATTSEHKFVPSATLSYKLNGGGNVYARWAEGWKAGGINPITPPADFPGTTGSIFGPETVDTYEVGYRAPLFDRSIELTTAVFYNNYRNLQVQATAQPQFPTITYAIVNADSARTYGVEETVAWKIAEPLTVGVAAGYLNAKYTDFKLTNGAVLVPFDRSGETMLDSPKFQLSLTGDLKQPLNDKFNLVGSLLASHVTAIIFADSGEPGVLPNQVQPGYWLVNLRIGLQTSDEKYGVALFARNLFNQFYATGGSSSAFLGNSLIPGDPRIVGGELTVKF